jgi:bifunctional oligoribonuclease and PAP phosphatase NrnA
MNSELRAESIKNIDKLKQFIDKHQCFIITAHQNPDGDSIGSEVAFFEFLKSLNKTIRIFNTDETPNQLKFLDVDNDIRVIRSEEDVFANGVDPKECGVVILDCKEPYRMGEPINKYVINKAIDTFVIDHHITSKIEENNIIITDIIATSEILYYIIKDYFNTEINFKIAQALFTGIYTDSGSFVYPRTTAKTYQIISEFVNLGVDPTFIYRNIEQRESISKVRLIGKLLNNIEYEENNKIAILKATRSILKEADATDEDLEGNDIVILPLKAEQTQISILCKEKIWDNGEIIVKVSLRSKADYNVRKVARKYGGGGHKNASGVRSRLPIDEVASLLVLELRKLLYENKKVH